MIFDTATREIVGRVKAFDIELMCSLLRQSRASRRWIDGRPALSSAEMYGPEDPRIAA